MRKHQTSLERQVLTERWVQFFPVVRFEPRTAGLEARMLPLCHAVPPPHWTVNIHSANLNDLWRWRWLFHHWTESGKSLQNHPKLLGSNPKINQFLFLTVTSFYLLAHCVATWACLTPRYNFLFYQFQPIEMHLLECWGTPLMKESRKRS